MACTDKTPNSKTGKAEMCGGSSRIEIYQISCVANWGWVLIGIALGCTSCYAGGTMAYNIKIKGLHGREALPHVQFWQQGYGLVQDGASFFASMVVASVASARASAGGGSSSGEPLLADDDGGATTPPPSATTESKPASPTATIAAVTAKRADLNGDDDDDDDDDDDGIVE